MSSIADRIRQFARPAAVFDDRTDRRDVQRLAEASKGFMLGKFFSVISESPTDRPVTRVYSADGMPLLINRAWARCLGSKVIRRTGKRCSEYICERTFNRGWDDQGGRTTAVLFRDPFPLIHGKDGWSLFACAMAAAPTLREAGFFGPAISCYCWDRGCFSVLDRVVRQWHMRVAAESPRPAAAQEALLDFVVTMPDTLHDASNAFMWSLRPHMIAESVTKDRESN